MQWRRCSFASQICLDLLGYIFNALCALAALAPLQSSRALGAPADPLARSGPLQPPVRPQEVNPVLLDHGSVDVGSTPSGEGDATASSQTASPATRSEFCQRVHHADGLRLGRFIIPDDRWESPHGRNSQPSLVMRACSTWIIPMWLSPISNCSGASRT